jgi:hypothetical protein
MSITSSPRLGLTRWSADGDAVARTQFDGDNAQLDSLTAIGLQDVLANRPAAGVARRVFYATDTGFHYWDTGSAWVKIGAGLSHRLGKPFLIAGPPVVSSGDGNPYPPMYIAVPSSQVVKLHAVHPFAALTSGTTYPTIKLRRFTSSAWADISGFGTTGAPLTADGTTTAPGDITLADGDSLGLWVVGAGANVASLGVTLVLDYYLN